MSFSSDVKERLCKTSNECEFCKRAELAAIVRYAGKIKEDELLLTSENEAVARCIVELLFENTGIDAKYSYSSQKRLYEVLVTDISVIENILDLIMISDEDYEELIPFDCCRGAYIRGAFLGGGSISDPKKSYHMEFDARFLQEAERLVKILEKAGLNAKVTSRKERSIVYIKDYTTIADVLSLIGDVTSAFDIYNISVEKDLRNSINRIMNCENANTDKIADAYKKHLSAIDKIKRTIGLSKLPEVLQEIAKVRVEYPEDSLKELGERLEKPIGKSGANHRLNRLVEIAEGIKEK